MPVVALFIYLVSQRRDDDRGVRNLPGYNIHWGQNNNNQRFADDRPADWIKPGVGRADRALGQDGCIIRDGNLPTQNKILAMNVKSTLTDIYIRTRQARGSSVI